MARSLQEIQRELDKIIVEVDKKVDKDTLKLELELVKKDLIEHSRNIERMNSYGRWVIVLIGGALVTAILNLILRTNR